MGEIVDLREGIKASRRHELSHHQNAPALCSGAGDRPVTPRAAPSLPSRSLNSSRLKPQIQASQLIGSRDRGAGQRCVLLDISGVGIPSSSR